MNNETKKGRGGARANSGAKSSGIKTTTVRIDVRLYPLVLNLKWELQDGNLSRDDIRELMKRADKTFIDDSSKYAELQARINQLEFENQRLKTNGNGLDKKLRKRLVQFCHPDKHQDERSKAIAVELVQELNKLGG